MFRDSNQLQKFFAKIGNYCNAILLLLKLFGKKLVVKLVFHFTFSMNALASSSLMLQGKKYCKTIGTCFLLRNIGFTLG